MKDLFGEEKMCLTYKDRRSVAAELAPRFQKGSKKEKSRILDEFIALTGLNRDYSATLLRNQGKKKVVYINQKRTVLIGDIKKSIETRGKNSTYDATLVKPLIKLWKYSDYLCSKRLVSYIRTFLPVMKNNNKLNLSDDQYAKLLKISSASIDRLTKPERKKYTIKGKSRTKPGTLLKHQIPIRTFCEWEEGNKPGFMEIDLVAHCNSDVLGDFCYTLDVTDIALGWTVCWPIQNKAQQWTLEALKYIRTQVPYPILGIDSDNGSEFINAHMVKYCKDNEITFTRSRPYRKNDNCYVEQKNYSVVRRFTGYLRYDTNTELELLKQLYLHVNLLVNFVQPSVKLLEKTRKGSKVSKKWDTAQTPYQRVMASDQVSKQQKVKLKKIMKTIDPIRLHDEIEKYQKKLWNYKKKKKKR